MRDAGYEKALRHPGHRIHSQSIGSQLVIMSTNSFIRKYFGQVLGAAILLCSFIGTCQVEAGDATSVVKVHLPGYSTSSLPFLIADELGFYRDEGIRIEITRIQTGSGIQALVANAVDVSQIVGPTTLAAILGGAPLKVVTVFNDKPTFKLYVKKPVQALLGSERSAARKYHAREHQRSTLEGGSREKRPRLAQRSVSYLYRII